MKDVGIYILAVVICLAVYILFRSCLEFTAKNIDTIQEPVGHSYIIGKDTVKVLKYDIGQNQYDPNGYWLSNGIKVDKCVLDSSRRID